jgi:hypothetical protein
VIGIQACGFYRNKSKAFRGRVRYGLAFFVHVSSDNGLFLGLPFVKE